jgi:hypothetical protein
LRFAAKTRQGLAGIGVITQNAFHRDDAAGMALARAIDDAHPTPADFFEDFVVTETPVLVWEIDFGERADERFRVAFLVRVEAALEQATDAKSAGDVRRGIATRT